MPDANIEGGGPLTFEPNNGAANPLHQQKGHEMSFNQNNLGMHSSSGTNSNNHYSFNKDQAAVSFAEKRNSFAPEQPQLINSSGGNADNKDLDVTERVN